MTLSKEMYPKKILDKELGYVYLARTDVGDKFVYKIGMSRDIRKRLHALSSRWGVRFDLLAYGCCKKPLDIEFELQQSLYEKYHFEILYELFYPMWSIEYFKLDYDGIIKAIRLMQTKCNCTIISHHYKHDVNDWGELV